MRAREEYRVFILTRESYIAFNGSLMITLLVYKWILRVTQGHRWTAWLTSFIKTVWNNILYIPICL